MKKTLFSNFLTAVGQHADAMVELKLAEVRFFCEEYQDLD